MRFLAFAEAKVVAPPFSPKEISGTLFQIIVQSHTLFSKRIAPSRKGFPKKSLQEEHETCTNIKSPALVKKSSCGQFCPPPPKPVYAVALLLPIYR